MRLSMLVLWTTLAAAQQYLSFTQVESPEGRAEILNALPSVLGKQSSVLRFNSWHMIQGDDAAVAAGEWLFHQLDGGTSSSEFAVPESGDIVSVFRPSGQRPPEAMAQTVIAVRACLDIQSIGFVRAANAIAMRAPADIARSAQWLLTRLDRVSGPNGDRITVTQRGREEVVMVFYPGNQPDRASLEETVMAMRGATDMPVVLISHSPDAIVWRGPAVRADLAAWVFHELDRPAPDRVSITHEYRRLTDADDDLVRIFYLTRTDTGDLQNVIRSQTHIRRMWALRGAQALVLRGDEQQIATAERMVRDSESGAAPSKLDVPKTYDVVSVKRSAQPESNPSQQVHPDGIDLRNMPLSALIVEAYSLRGYQLSGPAWMDTEKYDISAKTSAPVPRQQLWTMLQPVLVERFHLATHRQTKLLEGYALVVARGGLKISSVEKPDGPVLQRAHTNHNLTLKQAPLQDVARNLDVLLRCPVVDDTQVAGVFDIDIKWIPDAVQLASGAGRPVHGDPDGPSLFDVLEDKLGLKLEKRKVTVETLVVDRADKSPVEN